MQINITFNRTAKGAVIAASCIIFAMLLTFTINPNIVTPWNVLAVTLCGASTVIGVVTAIVSIVMYLDDQKD